METSKKRRIWTMMSFRAVEPRDYTSMMFSTFTNEKKRHLKSQGKEKIKR